MKKDILRYFIDYCKDSSGNFDVEMFVNVLDKGFVITNDKDEFEKPVDDIYVLGRTEMFSKITIFYDFENLEERETYNGFQNPGLTQLQILLGDDYSLITQNGLVELVTGNSKFINYPELFTITEIEFEDELVNGLPIIDKVVVISYDAQYNNIIISSIETFLKYAESRGPVLPSNLKYSITGEPEVTENGGGGGAEPA
jgi:hypothetical protein